MAWEYFKKDDFFITGRFKDYVDKLWVLNQIQQSHVRRLVDLYAIAAVVGLKKNRKLESEPSDEKRTVQLKQIVENYKTLNGIMTLVLLLDESRGLSPEERIRGAFRNPESEEEYRANMELFNSYARGGIEYMYQQLVTRIPDDDEEEHEDNRLTNIIAFMKNSMEPDEL